MERRVLFLSHDAIYEAAARGFLMHEGFTLHLAREDARGPYDYVLIDNSGKGNGIEACKKLKLEPAYAGSRFVLLSYMNLSPEMSLHLLESGISYLNKPFTRESLLQALYKAGHEKQS